MRKQPVKGLALGLHGAPLGSRDGSGNFAERTRVFRVGQAAIAEPCGTDEAAMYDQVGVAADR
jgi:hypothetical protein